MLRVKGKISLNSAPVAVKQKRPPGRAPPERPPEYLVRQRLCLRVGRGYVLTPVPSVLLLRGRSMLYWGRGVKKTCGRGKANLPKKTFRGGARLRGIVHSAVAGTFLDRSTW